MSAYIKNVFFVIVFLTGCTSNTLEDFYKASQSILVEVCKELHHVHTLEELVNKSPKLKKHMKRLTELMIEADQYHRKHPEAKLKRMNPMTSDRLRYELFRICEDIEGARSVLEEIQEEMLDKLDLYERRKKAALFR